MGWLDEMNHFMDDDVFEQVFGLLNQFGVQPDITGAMITAAPLGFHPLQEITGDFNF